MLLNSSTKGHHVTILQLPPGTHHVKFIVDGEMRLAEELPTAVDYTNILVNYVEVSADDIPRESPGEAKVSKNFDPPQVVYKGTEAKDHAPDSVGKNQIVDEEQKAEPVFWGKVVPEYLHDVDLPEQSKRYQRAARGVSDFSTPPGLPLFLGKSILNGTTPMKDDSSVLNMPNHTVLNHLATSSIKHDVLATSITTRYKRKVRYSAIQDTIRRASSRFSSMLQRSYTSPPEGRLKHTLMTIGPTQLVKSALPSLRRKPPIERRYDTTDWVYQTIYIIIGVRLTLKDLKNDILHILSQCMESWDDTKAFVRRGF